ncbi:MAG: serine hydrolase [Glaciihabitans sp.]|nr:serine hydrolase [Glaciihabitans sp.]
MGDVADTNRVRGRGGHARGTQPARHGKPAEGDSFSASFSALGSLAYDGAEVSAHVVDLRSNEVLLSIDDRIVLPVASVGKVLLLIEVAARMTETHSSVLSSLERDPELTVGDAGLWQHLRTARLPVADLAALVAATSDNMATNILLSRIGLDAVRERAETLDLAKTALLDRIRPSRGPDDAPYFSVGSTWELARLMSGLTRGHVVDPVTSERVLGWLALNADLSLVASAFGLDPLSHRRAEHGIHLVNKTGSDDGIRSEIGAVRAPGSSVSYALTIRFTDDSVASRLRVIDAMRTVGTDILEHVS